MNGIIMPDSTMKINLKESLFFTEATTDQFMKFPVIDNAQIKASIGENNTPLTFSPIGDGYYISETLPKPGDKISFGIEVPEMKPVTSEIIIPDLITLSIEEDRSEIRNQLHWKEFDIQLRVTINDPPATTNYYSLEILVLRYIDFEDMQGYYPWPQDLPQILETCNGEEELELYKIFKIFSDSYYAGKEISFTTKMTFAITDDFENNPKPKIFIQLKHYSEDYYRHTRSRIANILLDKNISEPVQIFSNIKGGAGVLGACAIYEYVIPVEVR